MDEGQQQSANSSRSGLGLGSGGPGSLTLVLKRIGCQWRHCHPQDSIPLPSVFLSSHSLSVLLSPTPSSPSSPTLLSLFHSPNINRVIWMSYIAGKSWWCQLLCADLSMAFFFGKDRLMKLQPVKVFSLHSVIYYYYFIINWFQFTSQLHTTNNKTIMISRQERKNLGFGFVLQGGLPPESC